MAAFLSEDGPTPNMQPTGKGGNGLKPFAAWPAAESPLRGDKINTCERIF